MIKKLKNYLERRAVKKRMEHFNDGFNWAAGTLLRGEATPVEIQSLMYGQEYDHFDMGADSAIDKLVELGVLEDDRI